VRVDPAMDGVTPDDPQVAAALAYALSRQRRYRQVEPFAQGGIGLLFLVYDGAGDKALLKIPAYHKRPPAEHHVLERDLVKEARILNDFSCDLVPRLISHDPSGRYLCRQFFEGWVLTDLPLSLERSKRAEIVKRIFETGAQLFERFHRYPRGGYVVGDLKPGNLVVEEHTPRVKLVDVGGVRPESCIVSKRARANKLGSGKWLFRPPEQLLGGEGLDRRVDLFALGATVFFVLTGRAPYDNLESNPGRVMDTYLSQYALVIWTTQAAASAVGLSSRAVDFLVRCLHPWAEARPWGLDRCLW
jgi:serine/threonine protein kinase